MKHQTINPVPAPAGAPVAQVLLSVEGAALALSMGRTGVFRLIKEGALKSVQVGRRRLVPVSELALFVARCQAGA